MITEALRTELSKSFDYGFTLSEQQLRSLYNIMTERMRIITENNGFIASFKMKYKNGEVVDRVSIDEVLSEENGDEKAIRALRIRLSDIPSETDSSPQSVKHEATITFTFDVDVPSNAISYDVLGNNRDWVFLTSSQLDEMITKVKRFSPVSLKFARIISIIASGAITFFIGVFSQILLSGTIGQTRINLSSFFIISILSLFILAVGIFVGFSLFPPYNFNWGNHVKNFERRKAISQIIIYGILIAFILGLVANIIATITLRYFSGGGSGG